MSKTFSQIYIQVVLAVQNRDALIKPEWEERLYQYITAIVQNKGQKMQKHQMKKMSAKN